MIHPHSEHKSWASSMGLRRIKLLALSAVYKDLIRLSPHGLYKQLTLNLQRGSFSSFVSSSFYWFASIKFNPAGYRCKKSLLGLDEAEMCIEGSRL